MDCRGTLVLITAETLVSVIFWFLSLSKSMQPYNAEGKNPTPLDRNPKPPVNFYKTLENQLPSQEK